METGRLERPAEVHAERVVRTRDGVRLQLFKALYPAFVGKARSTVFAALTLQGWEVSKSGVHQLFRQQRAVESFSFRNLVKANPIKFGFGFGVNGYRGLAIPMRSRYIQPGKVFGDSKPFVEKYAQGGDVVT